MTSNNLIIAACLLLAGCHCSPESHEEDAGRPPPLTDCVPPPWGTCGDAGELDAGPDFNCEDAASCEWERPPSDAGFNCSPPSAEKTCPDTEGST